MALPTAAPHRQLKHRRRIDVQVHARGNGLWEVDAEISDVKTRDIPTGGGNHLTELTQVLPTAVVQAFAGDVLDTRERDGERRPFQIDGCHALRADGPAVQIHSPRWYRGAASAARRQPAASSSET